MTKLRSITAQFLALLAHPEQAAASARGLALDLPATAKMLEYHRIAPWLHQRLQQAGALSALPPALQKLIDRQRLLESARGLGRHQDLLRLDAELALADVPVYLLKGAALAYRYYSNPLLRPMSDLDLLIDIAHYQTTAAVLDRLGYICSLGPDLDPDAHNLAEFSHPTAFHIDLHKHFESPGQGLDIALSEVFSRAAPHPLLTHSRVFSPEDQFIHCCLHASLHHGWRISLMALVDIQQMLISEPGLDWPLVAQRARQWQALVHVAAVISVVCDRFDTPWPAEARRLLRPLAPAGNALREIVEILCFDYIEFKERSPEANKLFLRWSNLRQAHDGNKPGSRLLSRLVGRIDESGSAQPPGGIARLPQMLQAWLRAGRALLAFAGWLLSPQRRREVRTLLDYDAKRRKWQAVAMSDRKEPKSP